MLITSPYLDEECARRTFPGVGVGLLKDEGRGVVEQVGVFATVDTCLAAFLGEFSFLGVAGIPAAPPHASRQGRRSSDCFETRGLARCCGDDRHSLLGLAEKEPTTVCRCCCLFIITFVFECWNPTAAKALVDTVGSIKPFRPE